MGDFIFLTLSKLWFFLEWVKWVFSLYWHSIFEIKVNGEMSCIVLTRKLCAWLLCLNNAHDINVQTIQVDEWHLCLFHMNLWKINFVHDYYCQIMTHEIYDVHPEFELIGTNLVQFGQQRWKGIRIGDMTSI
jgi:hypothetical protein